MAAVTSGQTPTGQFTILFDESWRCAWYGHYIRRRLCFCENVAGPTVRPLIPSVCLYVRLSTCRFGEKSVAEWLTVLRESGVPHGPINNMQQVFSDPQVKSIAETGYFSTPSHKSYSVESFL